MSFSKNVAERVLVDTGRCCALCHKFCGFKIELHHIKQKADGGEDIYENCIPLCFDCHAEMKVYNPRHPKGKKYSETELIMHRNRWYEKVKASGLIHTDEKLLILDKEIYERVRKLVYDEGTIMFLREHHFANPFELDKLNPLRALIYEVEYNPEFEFIDSDLEHTFADLISKSKKFLGESAVNTFSHEVLDGYQYVPKDWLYKSEESAKNYRIAVELLNELSTSVVDAYDNLAKLARRKFV